MLENSGAFNFSVFKVLLNALHCGDKFMVKSLPKAPAPTEVDNNEEQQMTLTIWKKKKKKKKKKPFFPYPKEVPHKTWLKLAQWF